MTTEKSELLGWIQTLAATIGEHYGIIADGLVALESIAVGLVVACWTFALTLQLVVIPAGSYLKARGFEAVAWAGFAIAYLALILLFAHLASKVRVRSCARQVVVILDQLLPVSSVLTRFMRGWSVVAASGSAVTFSYQNAPQGDLPNFAWLWMLSILACPLLPLSYIVENRPSEAAMRDQKKKDRENREIQLIAVQMALSDQVNVGGRKCWMIEGEPVDAESELGKKWLVVATTAHLMDAIAAFNRGRRVGHDSR